MKNLIKLILIGALIMCFSKCRTAGELLNKALDKDSATVARATSKIWPCVTGKVTGTDSTEYIKWRKALDETTSFYDSLLSNVEPQKEYIKDAQCERNLQICRDNNVQLSREIVILRNLKVSTNEKIIRPPAIHDTVRVTDMKLIWLANKEAENYRNELDKVSEQRDKLEKKLKNSRTENWIWRIIAAILIFLWILRMWNKITTIKIQSPFSQNRS